MPVDRGHPVTDTWPLNQGPDADLLLDAAHAFPPDPDRHIGVAVSGGGDSMALLHLMVRVCRHHGVPISAVTVDHGLRAGSAAEAATVDRFCAALSVPHRTVAWQHGAIVGNLMDAARKARRALIAEWAQDEGVTGIALGHTSDDAAETFLMGLARSSGLDGLVGLRARWRDGDLLWARPLVAHSRAHLRAYLRRQGIDWVDDPTNEDTRYERVRARRAIEALAPLGIDAATLGTTILHLRIARVALLASLAEFARLHVHEVAGALRVDRAAFATLPFDQQRRLAIAATRWIGAGGHPPRSTPQLRLTNALRDGRAATLGGCRFRSTTATLLASRELSSVATLTTPVVSLWDNRWIVEGPPGTVRALGPKGLPQVRNWRALGIPRDVLLVTPAVWDGDTLLAAPLAGMENGWKARIATPFHRFLVSD